MVNLKTSPTDSKTELWHMELKPAQKRAWKWPNSTNAVVQVLAWIARGQRRWPVLSTLGQPCARMAPALQKSASGLPQQWQQWRDQTGSGEAIPDSEASSSCTGILQSPSSSMAVRHGPCFLSEKRTQAFRIECLRKLLHISYLQQKTNNWVRSKINFFVGPEKPHLATVTRRKLAWFRHVTCHDSLSKITLHSPLESRLWLLKAMAELHSTGSCCRKDWKRLCAESSVMSPDDSIGQGTDLNYCIYTSTILHWQINYLHTQL